MPSSGSRVGHDHCMAKGAGIKEMMAELFGKETGYCKGLGGSMHIADMDLNQLITPDHVTHIRQEIEAELEEAVTFAECSPEPTVEVMERALYAPRLVVSAPPAKRGHEFTFTEALNEALKQEMRRDPRVFVMGEDVDLIGGIF